MRQYFEKLPGTGIVINSVVFNDLGQPTFFIPIVAYSCPPNTWSSHCSDINVLKRSLSVCLVIFSTVMILNLVSRDMVEAVQNGLLIGSFLTFAHLNSSETEMSEFGVFMSTIFGGIALGGIFSVVALHFHIGRYLSKLVFSSIIMAIIMETFFEDTTSVYLQLGGTIVLSIGLACLELSCSVFLGGLLLIMGLSHLLKIGNIHRFIACNVNALTLALLPGDSLWSFTRQNFINYKVRLNLLDFAFIVFYILSSIFFTIRKETYFRELETSELLNHSDNIEEYNRVNARKRRQNCVIGIRIQKRLNLVSRCRRPHYRSNVIHERSPLISHWVASDDSEDVDDVFVSPNSNSRFMRTLSSDSRERVEAIQNFQR